MFNVSIAGRLSKDAEYKKAGAYDLAEFTIAVSHPRDETSFIKCQVWGKRYESILDAYKKGCLVCVSGNAKYTEYTNAGERLKIQGELLTDNFENWKMNMEQIDDVCVIGIKI